MITVGSLFAGIGGIEKGLEDTGGFRTVWQVEIEKNANSVRARHWPDTARYEDVTKFTADTNSVRPDLICGGFPCQDLSVAGKRAGLAGSRSGLFHEFMRIVSERTPRWVLAENVPGLLSSNEGRDMGIVLSTLAELGYGTAYRILDAQWFGVAQRRRRVFIVGCLGDWRRAAEVLFERESLPWHPTPSRETGAHVASCVRGGTESGSNESGNKVAMCLNAKNGNRYDGESETFVARPLKSGGNDRHDESHETYVVGPLQSHSKDHGHAMTTQQAAESGHVLAFDTTQVTSDQNYSNPKPGDPSHPLAAGMHPPAVAYQCHGSNVGPMGHLRAGNGNETGGVPFVFQASDYKEGTFEETNLARPLTTSADRSRAAPVVRNLMRVRRLTPRECERLQGFPDDWTRYGADGQEISDSARYRMLGNAVAVPVVQWIGQRILETES